MLEILQSIFTVNNLLMMNVGVAVGIMIGAMPGLSVAFAVTILMTMTFHMESLPAMYLMLGCLLRRSVWRIHYGYPDQHTWHC